MWFPPAIVVVGEGYFRVVGVKRLAPGPGHDGGDEDEDAGFDDLRAAFLRQLLGRFGGFFDAGGGVDDVEDDDVGFL